MKLCTYCNETKELSCFNRNPKTKDSLQGHCKPCCSKQRKVWVKSNPEWERDKELKRKFSIDLKQYNQMLEAQNGVCASCGEPETALSSMSDKIKNLAVDHDHTTNKVRALLCNGCNSAEGHLQGDPSKARKLADYMEKYKCLKQQ